MRDNFARQLEAFEKKKKVTVEIDDNSDGFSSSDNSSGEDYSESQKSTGPMPGSSTNPWRINQIKFDSHGTFRAQFDECMHFKDTLRNLCKKHLVFNIFDYKTRLIGSVSVNLFMFAIGP